MKQVPFASEERGNVKKPAGSTDLLTGILEEGAGALMARYLFHA